jgi:hypothetical protein
LGLLVASSRPARSQVHVRGRLRGTRECQLPGWTARSLGAYGPPATTTSGGRGWDEVCIGQNEQQLPPPVSAASWPGRTKRSFLTVEAVHNLGVEQTESAVCFGQSAVIVAASPPLGSPRLSRSVTSPRFWTFSSPFILERTSHMTTPAGFARINDHLVRRLTSWYGVTVSRHSRSRLSYVQFPPQAAVIASLRIRY